MSKGKVRLLPARGHQIAARGPPLQGKIARGRAEDRHILCHIGTLIQEVAFGQVPFAKRMSPDLRSDGPGYLNVAPMHANWAIGPDAKGTCLPH